MKRLISVICALTLCAGLTAQATASGVVGNVANALTAADSNIPAELSKLPTTVDEYYAFVGKYGACSVHGKYLVCCCTVNPSTGYSVWLEQHGDGSVKLFDEYALYRESPDGIPVAGASGCGVFVYEAVTSGKLAIDLCKGREWDLENTKEIIHSDELYIGSDLSFSSAVNVVKGDVNGDGMFTSADLVTFGRWLLNRSDAKIASSDAADLIKDGRLDVYDLCAMRRMVMTNAPIYYITEVSGTPVVNPHKGYIMTTYSPHMFSEKYKYGIGGELDNHAWDLVTVCSGAHYWKDINTAEGVYDWTEIDDMLEVCDEHNMTYVIRIIPYSTSIGSNDDYGKAHDLVPQYLYDKGLKHTDATLRNDSSVHVRVPDWSDPIYIQGCKDFAKAMAERYDGDPRVEFIDVRTFGNWGEWHTAQIVGSQMPSDDVLMDMLDYYASVFTKTQLAVPSDASGDVYAHALKLGITKRNDGLIAIPDREADLIPAYEANLPTIAEYQASYETMLQYTDIIPGGYLRWTPERFRNAIETAHMTMMALDQPSDCGYKIYSEQKDVLKEMINRMGYNFTVTSAMLRGRTLNITVKNTGLAPAFFDIDLTAELTDDSGNKLGTIGKPIRIDKGTFADGSEQQFTFVFDSQPAKDATICLAMYESAKSSDDPTVRFDNTNTLPNNRLKLVY